MSAGFRTDQGLADALVDALAEVIDGNGVTAAGTVVSGAVARHHAAAVLAELLGMDEAAYPKLTVRLGLMFVLQEFSGRRTVYTSVWDGRMWRSLRAVELPPGDEHR